MSIILTALRQCVALASLMGVLAAPAWAENHALIMWIGDYGNPKVDLPGIDLDAAIAKKIAASMGVPPKNISELANANLTRKNMATSLLGLIDRIRDGDKVFLYYSGHGAQVPGHETQARCTEAMAVRDGLFIDADLQEILTRLGRKASQVVMMNDSCFSGGAATKSVIDLPDGGRAKFLPLDSKVNTAVSGDYSCGDPTNTNKMTRSLTGMAKDARGPQVLYVAASSDTQVSIATNRGSIATLAWAQCLASASSDTDGSGSINGEEMQACAQKYIDARRIKQTITLQGNAKLPLTFVQPAPAQPATSAAPAATSTTTATANPPPARVNAAQTLHDLRAAADRSFDVQLTLARTSLRIGQDFLDFSVSSNREGYVYVLQVGSDGKTFNLLFPNKIDANNFVQPGTQRLPRESWRLRSGGPVGASHLIAIVSPEKKDLSRDMDMSAVFPNSPATAAATRTLVVEATGAGVGGSGRYGASDVMSVNETN